MRVVRGWFMGGYSNICSKDVRINPLGCGVSVGWLRVRCVGVGGLPGRNLGGFGVFGRILCSLRVNVLVRASEEQTNAQGVDKLWISCG